MRMAVPRWTLGVLIAGVLGAILVESRAQLAPGDEAQVLTADQALGDAVRAGDKSIARRLLSLQFTFVDANGKVHERRDFIGDLKSSAAAASTDTKAKIYGRIGAVTGNRKTADGNEAFFLDIWAKQKGSWRALVMQDVVLAAGSASPGPPSAPHPEEKTSECKNPCLTIPYRVRSPAEQDIVNSFQAIEKAVVAHDADEWARHVADEFVLYGSNRAPIPKSSRIATIKRQKDNNTPVTVGEVESMRLSVYDDGAAMIASHAVPNGSRPPYRAARVWVKRNGQWQMTISVQTDIK